MDKIEVINGCVPCSICNEENHNKTIKIYIDGADCWVFICQNCASEIDNKANLGGISYE